jgi:hypothetical protein
MRIHLKKKVIFFSILVVILILMNLWMDRETNPHYPLQYDEVFHPKVNADVIILGASSATHGINPKYLETDRLKVYNFSLNGAGPSFYLKWYRKIFQPHYRKPLCVIYAVQWGMFDNNLLQRRLEQDSKYFPSEFFNREFSDQEGVHNLKTYETLLLNRIALFRERKHLAERLFKKTQKVFILPRYYHGFIPYERRGRLDNKKDIKPKNNDAQIRDFEALLDEFEKNNIAVIFVQVPGYLPARYASNIEEGMQLINQIAEKRKIPFLDYETKRVTNINSDPSMFSDWVHLNEKGSDAFSKLLQSDLKCLLPQGAAKETRPST